MRAQNLQKKAQPTENQCVGNSMQSIEGSRRRPKTKTLYAERGGELAGQKGDEKLITNSRGGKGVSARVNQNKKKSLSSGHGTSAKIVSSKRRREVSERVANRGWGNHGPSQ